MNQNEGNRNFSAICTYCRTKVITNTYLDLLEHYNKHCGRLSQSSNDNKNPLPNDIITQYDETSDDIQYFHESIVSQRELNGQKRIHANQSYNFVPGFKCKYSPSTHGLERIGECQQCSKVLKKPSSQKLTIHR